MIRKWIEVGRINPFTDKCHVDDGKGGFIANKEHDGQDTAEHLASIEFIKAVIKDGQKIRPILVLEKKDGDFDRLDGFKRLWAHRELGEKMIEAFVCDEEEYKGAVEYPYGIGKIRAWHGGLPKEEHGLFEGNATENFDYEKIKFLFKSPNPAGLRIEYDECIHVHWGEFGRYRFTLGRKDFEALAEAISQI